MGVYQEEEKVRDKYWKNKNKKKCGQIPAFGNWDYENELPITQYFESARQAGLIRFSNVSDSEECHIYAHSQAHANIQQLYALHFHHCNNYKPPMAKVRQAKENRMRPLKAEKRSKKEDYQIEQPKPSIAANKNSRVGVGVTRVPPTTQKKNAINIKAVDEDLYKIPPELLRSCKRMLGACLYGVKAGNARKDDGYAVELLTNYYLKDFDQRKYCEHLRQ